jgi:hypothetical protein
MKRLKATNQGKVRNEGYTKLELAAEIRRRAYRLYEERGRADGHAPEDWAQAEAEVLQQDRKSAAA